MLDQMYLVGRLRFGLTKKVPKPKPEVAKPLKVIQVDFPLPTGLAGSVHRINPEASTFVIPEDTKKKHVKARLVGGVIRNEQLQVNYEKYLESTTTIAGWVKSSRAQGGSGLIFIDVNDGSHPKSVQVVVNKEWHGYAEVQKVKTAYSVRATGVVKRSLGGNQAFELVIDRPEHVFKIVGICDDPKYPLAAKYHKPQFLRQVAHLRSRTNLISAMTRVKNNLAFATHVFFQHNGFYYIKTPLITTSDCEGAGEMFQVTTLLPKNLQVKDVPSSKGKIDYSRDFFKREAFLTVSGQLEVQTYAIGMSNVYTFGPTFRAEASHTPRHMAQFWMIEPELAFADLFDVIECAESYIRFCLEYILENNLSDLTYFEQNAKTKQGLVEYLRSMIKEPFAKCSYSEAVDILLKCRERGVEFENDVYWGVDFNSEHQKYLCGVVFGRPTIIYNYPSGIKSFYMRENEGCQPGRQTVANFDILAPDVGEIVGGSQREERLDVLEEKIKKKGMKLDQYWWYLQLRKYGTAPHGGFGLGFQRLVMMCTGIDNIRDIVPFPRCSGNAEF